MKLNSYSITAHSRAVTLKGDPEGQQRRKILLMCRILSNRFGCPCLEWEMVWSMDPQSFLGSCQLLGWWVRDLWASLLAQMVKNLPAVQETRVWFLGWWDPLEKGMTTHSSVLAWEISWTEVPGELQSTASQRVRHDWVTNTFAFTLSRNRIERLVMKKIGKEVMWMAFSEWAQTTKTFVFHILKGHLRAFYCREG